MNIAEITLGINGEARALTVRNADTLLYVLRDKLGLTGAKPGCLNGDCGACTIDVDGNPMKSCLMLAVEAEGARITTVEGLTYTALQTQFVDKFAFQCGYCTPGFIMNAQALIRQYPHATDKTITEWLESNICRCTGYKEIEEAVKAALAVARTSLQL
ncbi:(2Fe-2S)-binding protein [Paenibacillus sp. J5C_2022]|uniref:(2Fe-2S)-binding protein n=1 Tax=Paenibacillus sp. J5C2022 TaxID=2977129 RepID=UPI0021D21BCB|nr:(2Fe-2S)-binding protein [Paenibacillus sp. J5C2022]MCU6711927.1 (2Fe-2S)-binding protein [Paenibacillus sp. J5C2022]